MAGLRQVNVIVSDPSEPTTPSGKVEAGEYRLRLVQEERDGDREPETVSPLPPRRKPRAGAPAPVPLRDASPKGEGAAAQRTTGKEERQDGIGLGGKTGKLVSFRQACMTSAEAGR